MAAYGALVSVMHIIDQIQLHPRPPISLDESQVESLTEKVTFLQEFLEGYSHVGYSKEADDLELRIVDAAYAAEDVIESHIADQILAGSTSHGEKISSIDFYQSLQKVIENIDSIKKEIEDIDSIKKEVITRRSKRRRIERNSTSPGSLRSSSTGQNTMVGFDDALHELKDKLTCRQQSNLQIIPIVGMGGIGKTTLSRNTYEDPLIKGHFDICAWATISQTYNTREIFIELLRQANKPDTKDLSEYDLGEMLYQHLSGRRYLIVMDDMWSIEAWDEVRRFFPDNKNGSRIVITTRLSNLSFQLGGSNVLEMKFLDKDESWKLFCNTVFGEDGCPSELVEIGKKIAKGCKGLPLSITVIGGLLAKSNHAQEYWEHIEENLNSIVNSEDNEHCLKILHLSYNQLPVHLKPCFLYMGVFEEDSVIRVSTLIKLWAAEGFLKPISGKSLEVVAEEYFKDLIDRNLILVRKLGSTGNIKYCKIHDILRDLCLREAEKQKFYNFTWRRSLNIPQCLNTQCRIIILESNPEEEVLDDALRSIPLVRSLICDIETHLPSLNFGLLRILKAFDRGTWNKNSWYVLEDMFELVNLRYLAVTVFPDAEIPSSFHLLWNLHTLIVDNYLLTPTALAEIWKMPQLRHVNFVSLYLPDPPSRNVDGRDDIVLENLQTLVTIENFKCGGEVIKRIPNIKKLGILYSKGSSGYCLNNLDRLHKLESLYCECSLNFSQDAMSEADFLQNLTFPHSLKKLNLNANDVNWEDMLKKIGSLPLLEKLKLTGGSFKGGNWETDEGQFRSLKFLEICGYHLEYWTTESTHFPRLEHLVLTALKELKEIPSGIGEIPTLRLITLQYCSDSAVISAQKILEEQEEQLGEVGLQVRVIPRPKKKVLRRLASPNFQFTDNFFD